MAARLWMRLISDQPEFSWNGTIFIVAAPTIIGAVLGLAFVSRRNRWPRRARMMASIFAGLSVILIAVGAGALMVPTVVFGGLAMGHIRLAITARIVGACAVLGLGVLVGSGSSPVAIAISIVAAILLAIGFQPRWVLAGLAVIATTGVGTIVLDASLPVWRTAAGLVLYVPLVGILTIAYGRAIAPPIPIESPSADLARDRAVTPTRSS